MQTFTDTNTTTRTNTSNYRCLLSLFELIWKSELTCILILLAMKPNFTFAVAFRNKRHIPELLYKAPLYLATRHQPMNSYS